MRELVVQAANGNSTMDNTERGYLQQEFNLLFSELDRIVNVTEHNGQKFADGSISKYGYGIDGAGMNNTANDRISLSWRNAQFTGLGDYTDTLATASNAQAAIDALDTALGTINAQLPYAWCNSEPAADDHQQLGQHV